MVKAIHQMHTHKDKADVHSVLSVAGLHGDFMKDNGALTQCLKWLVEQGCSVHMGKQQEMAFNMVKQAMSDKWVVVLAHTEWSHEVHTDANTVDVGCVLLQHH